MYFNAARFLRFESMPLSIMANMYRQDLASGLIQVYASPTEQMDCLFFAGELFNVFVIHPEGSFRLPAIDMQSALQSRASCKAQAINLTPHGLRLYKAFVESCVVGNTFTEKTENITERLAEWQAATEPTFAAIHWPTADALVYLAGKTSFIRQAIFVTPETVESDLYPAVTTWDERECSITVFPCNPNTPAQTELYLQLTFNHLATHLMTRYREIGGRSLLETLSAEFNQRMQSTNLDINVYSGSIIDKQFFQNAETAASAYQNSLGLITRHLEAVIGPALLQKAITQGLDNTVGFMPTITHAWHLLPETYLASQAGGRPA